MTGGSDRSGRPGRPLSPLPRPRTAIGARALDLLVARPEAALLALDYDGVLAPIVPDPAAARPTPGVVGTLGVLGARLGRIVVVTGRPVAAVRELGGFDGVAGLRRLTIAGLYGVQRYDAATGELAEPAPPAGLREARRWLAAREAAGELPAGTYLEEKGHAIGVHVRRAADPAAALARLTPQLTRLAGRTGLRLEPGRAVLELRAPDADKGRALAAALAEADPRVACYVGDDRADIPAFAALARWRSPARPALAVRARSAETDDVAELARLTDLDVDGAAGVAELLAGWAARIG